MPNCSHVAKLVAISKSVLLFRSSVMDPSMSRMEIRTRRCPPGCLLGRRYIVLPYRLSVFLSQKCDRANQDGTLNVVLLLPKRTYRAMSPQDIINEGKLHLQVSKYAKVRHCHDLRKRRKRLQLHSFD